MNRALIDIATGRCENIIVVGNDYTPPEGKELQTPRGANIGFIWNGTDYDPIPQEVVDEAERQMVRQLAPVIKRITYELNKRIRVLEGKPIESKSEVNEILRKWIK